MADPSSVRDLRVSIFKTPVFGDLQISEYQPPGYWVFTLENNLRTKVCNQAT